MPDYIELRSTAATEGRSIRAQTTYPNPPHILGTKIGQINAGNVGEASPNDFYVYSQDVVISGEVMARAGDKWWKVYKANGQPINGWVAERHLGRNYTIPRLVTVEGFGFIPLKHIVEV